MRIVRTREEVAEVLNAYARRLDELKADRALVYAEPQEGWVFEEDEYYRPVYRCAISGREQLWVGTWKDVSYKHPAHPHELRLTMRPRLNMVEFVIDRPQRVTGIYINETKEGMGTIDTRLVMDVERGTFGSDDDLPYVIPTFDADGTRAIAYLPKWPDGRKNHIDFCVEVRTEGESGGEGRKEYFVQLPLQTPYARKYIPMRYVIALTIGDDEVTAKEMDCEKIMNRQIDEVNYEL